MNKKFTFPRILPLTELMGMEKTKQEAISRFVLNIENKSDLSICCMRSDYIKKWFIIEDVNCYYFVFNFSIHNIPSSATIAKINSAGDNEPLNFSMVNHKFLEDLNVQGFKGNTESLYFTFKTPVNI